MNLKVISLLQKVEARTAGQLFLVGGCVRDELMGNDAKDVDVLVRNVSIDLLKQVLEGFGRVNEVGKSFGVTILKPFDHTLPEIEFALPRKEISTGDGHKDFEVEFDPSISVVDDLSRRDFAMNAMAMRLSTGEIIDPFMGREDIERGIVNFVSPSSAKEDPLRMLRAIRFISKLGFSPSARTLGQIVDSSPLIATVAKERVRDELVKILVGKNAATSLRYARANGLLHRILGDVEVDRIEALREMRNDDPIVRLTSLIFDKDIRGKMRTLRFSKDEVDRAAGLAAEMDAVVEGMFPGAAARALLSRLVKLPGSLDANAKAVVALNPRVDAATVFGEIVTDPPIRKSDLAVDGNDLIEAGFKGKEIGQILDRMLNLVIQVPSFNDEIILMGVVADDFAVNS